MKKYGRYVILATFISVEALASPVLPREMNKNAFETTVTDQKKTKPVTAEPTNNSIGSPVTANNGKNDNDVITPLTKKPENVQKPQLPSEKTASSVAKNNISGVIRADSSGQSRRKTSSVSDKDYVVKLPISEMYVIKREKDSSFQFADSSGRYAIYKGELYDLWDNKKKLNSRDKMEYSFTHIPVERLRSVRGLNEIVLDSNKNSTTKGREVFIFLDPMDNGSLEVVKAFTKSINSGFYHTRIALASTEENSEIVSLFACSSATGKEKLTALISMDYTVLRETHREECVSGSFTQNTNSFIRYLGIKELPFLIAPSGRFVSGYVDNPFDFVQNRK